MPEFSVSPNSIVNQIKSNLQDRYDSGFPILKELLQNADDSRARKVCLDALPGWSGAANPLLRGPGLLVVNDGEFRQEDASGITSFGESSKATDNAAIGKFGLGQKAVFHLCDAFIVYAYGLGVSFNTVINPFLRVKCDGNVTHDWEQLTENDLELLRRSITLDFPERGLILWLPFRREGLEPASGVSFSTNRPTSSQTITELARPDDLRVILSALRHLEYVELRARGQSRCSVSIHDAAGRLLGPDRWPKGSRTFGGVIKSSPSTAISRFVGREATITDTRFEQLRRNPHWPKTISVFKTRPEPEKGEPHAAATLLRVPHDSYSQLKISWAVFLPIAETADIVLPLNGVGLGQFQVLLHGYFFLDSGRKHIEGLNDRARQEVPADAAGLRRAWNVELRDSVVLPLIPGLLRDTLDAQMVTSAELAQLVAALATSSWFRSNRGAVCIESALARVFEAPNSVIWRLAPGSKLRPLPKIVVDAPTRLPELFPDIHTWAQSHDIVLCVDESASLTSEPMRWKPHELDSLFAKLSVRAFQVGALAPLLAEFLIAVERDETTRQAVGPRLVSTLRKAMGEASALAPTEHISTILAYVPQDLLFRLPPSVEHRHVLGALSLPSAGVLPVRDAWLQDTHHSPRIAEPDLKVLLRALEPLIDGENADQAATASLALLSHAEREISGLARHAEFSAIKVLKGRNLRVGGVVAISLRNLLDASQAGLLFATSPEANRLLPPLVEALPDADPLIVEGKTAEFLKERGGSELSIHPVTKDVVLALINRTSRFGPEDARSRLLDRLRPSDEDDRTALRRLCAGAKEAGIASADLWVLDGAPEGIERIVTNILSQSANDFLVPSRIANDLTPRMRTRLGIKTFDTPGLQALLEKYVDMIPNLQPTELEREVFLLIGLSDALLLRLPIHGRSDGSIGTAEGIFQEAGWSIPPALKQHVLTIRLSQNPDALKKQQDLVPAWSPQAQIQTALSQLEPHTFQLEILDALDRFFEQNEKLPQDLTGTLRQVRWLVAEGTPIAPQDILALPQAVGEAARAVLLSGAERPPFFLANKLQADIREHPAFPLLEKHVLPDQRSSFDALAMMVDDIKAIGRVGEAGNYPVADFCLLADVGANLCLPGWALLAAILKSIPEDHEQVQKIILAFSQVPGSAADMAASHLDALAALADEGGRKGEAARRAYFHGFDVVAAWPEDEQQRVFRGTRVPNETGGWRSGCEVVADGDGVAPTHVLARDFASKLRKRKDENLQKSISGNGSSNSGVAMPVHRGEISYVDLPKLEAKCVEQHRVFLQSWRGHVPSDIVIIYLGLIGRFPGIRELAGEWESGATKKVDILWADLDRHLNPTLFPNPLPDEISQRRFLIEEIDGVHTRAAAMSGDIFNAPLAGGSGHILVGNLHKRSQAIRSADGLVRSLIALPLQRLDVSAFVQRDASAIFRNFVETVAADCLLLVMPGQQNAVREILAKAVKVDQATLEETERLLRDRLPTILEELKLPTELRSQKALREYQEAEGRLYRLSGSPDEGDKLKTILWGRLRDQHVAVELLTALRAKIREFGYSPSRVLFELFQNADDAYRQLDSLAGETCFRVELISRRPGGFRVVHWGRRINHLGLDAEEGRRLGHDRDLLSMLVMNFSEKRANEDLTGKFGLGFKSVHVLSDSVGIASGFVALRTLGGFLPEAWPGGLDEAERRKQGNGQNATIIDVPFTFETAEDGEEAVRAFRAAMTWMPAFARRIKRIEITDIDPVNIVCTASPLLGEDAIDAVSIHGTRRQRALRFNLGERYGLLLKIDSAGPDVFPEGLGRLWNLAPLEEPLHSGWLLNGPFAVDPGRGRLAGSIADRQETFRHLGRNLGECLLRLHDLASGNWNSFATTLDLDTSESPAQSIFWSRFFDVISLDFDDDLARLLHADRHGYGRLASERAVVPTGLPRPLNHLVRGSEVDHFADGALSEKIVLEKVRDWVSLSGLQGRVVAQNVAVSLRKLGFGIVRPITLSDLLRHEMGNDNRIDAGLASRLGAVITPKAIEEEPFNRERTSILETAKQAMFLMQDGTWRPAQLPNSTSVGDDEEGRLCAFAPNSALLDQSYSGDAISFFRVARQQSGQTRAQHLPLWAATASDQARQIAVLRYIISGDHGAKLADEVRKNTPSWMPQPPSTLRNHPWLSGWSEKDKDDLLYALEGRQAFASMFGAATEEVAEPEKQYDARGVLKAVHDWWIGEKSTEREAYKSRVYPEFFSPRDLRATDDRTAWFTMFALAFFHSFGRTQDGQHRGFLEVGWRERWWQELALSRPPSDVQSWIGRLERWSSPEQFDQNFLPWRRTFVDLYTVSRWLDEYIELIKKLPRFVEARGPISLNDILRPSYSPIVMPLGIDAAPLSRSIGIGMNWMIRELLRGGVYDPTDEKFMAPYCWSSSRRVRNFLELLGAKVGESADKETSRAIHKFVTSQIGDDRARFDGDFDLPLQLITLPTHRAAFERCFEVTGRAAPSVLDLELGNDGTLDDEMSAS